MIFITILFLGILYLSKYNQKLKSFLLNVLNKPVNYVILLLLIVYGYYYGLDYSERFGCLIGGSPNIEFKSLLFSSISFSLILVSFLFKNRKIKLLFLSLELLFWIFKLFYLKGGYIVGIAASYDSSILFFDSITLLFRLLILNSLFKVKFSNLKLIVSVLLLMSIKVYVFPVQLINVYEEYSSLKRSEITKVKLVGTWSGIMKYNSIEDGKSITVENNIRFIIDSNVSFVKDTNMEYEFSINFRREFSGDLIYLNETEYFESLFFFINTVTEDSLDVVLFSRVYDYRVYAKKE